MSDRAILTTRERIAALVRMLDHEHIAYSDEGALVRAFLHDAEAALDSPRSAELGAFARENPGRTPVALEPIRAAIEAERRLGFSKELGALHGPMTSWSMLRAAVVDRALGVEAPEP